MIRSKTARNLLYAWHGGMMSPFYAAASSGLVEDWQALRNELQSCYNVCKDRHDSADLARLLDWLVDQRVKCVNRIVIHGNHRYIALPWAKYEGSTA
jgi:hypothetical protein